MDEPRADSPAPPAESRGRRAVRSLIGLLLGAALLGGSSYAAPYFLTHQPEAPRNKHKRKGPHV